MRRDSIFYALFQQYPALLFDLLEHPPPDAQHYRFDAVAVKEPKFEIDGVFLPPEAETPGVVYFCEVQFQKDEQLYERLFGESFLYFYRNRSRFSDWQAVVIYPDRPTEQTTTHPYRALLTSDQVHRVYLNELGDIQQLPLGVALMALTTVDEADAPAVARSLLSRSGQEKESQAANRTIMEMITTIMVYKFTALSRQEVEAMLGLNLKETRVYQEAKAEGHEEGREEEGRSLILRQLNRCFRTLPEDLHAKITSLSIAQIESLAEALLEFQTIADLENWLNQDGSIDP
ncbi:Rpn family recombination-promoting nuclease/putative transposase [Egbenema bharatensis]|uniref:Rpn family recombination-promoting nuclease/putative transposase n=1 Tax=Egbenema bharatensis TaxID=3463334 RepID=UPI003A8906DB